MSETKAETARTRRRFTDEFKQDAVRLVVNEGYTFATAAKAVGVGEQSLRKWHAKLAPKPAPCSEDASPDELREEIKRLRRELRRAELEREILKKLRRILRRSRCEIRLDSRTSRLVSRRCRVRAAGGLFLGLLRLVRSRAQPTRSAA